MSLLLGYFQASVTSGVIPRTVFTATSHDIIAHETTHALLDGLRARFLEPTNLDIMAFHEAFADIVALFQHFTLPEALRHQIAATRGDLEQQSLLGQLAAQFGAATGALWRLARLHWRIRHCEKCRGRKGYLAAADLVPLDEQRYRIAFISAFRDRGIDPPDVKHLSPDSLLWEPPTVRLRNVRNVLNSMSIEWDVNIDRKNAEDLSLQNAAFFWRWLHDNGEVSDEEIAALGLVRFDRPRLYRLGAARDRGPFGSSGAARGPQWRHSLGRGGRACRRKRRVFKLCKAYPRTSIWSVVLSDHVHHVYRQVQPFS
jgi:hypothetical protein